jgi:hypothetical protein
MDDGNTAGIVVRRVNQDYHAMERRVKGSLMEASVTAKQELPRKACVESLKMGKEDWL